MVSVSIQHLIGTVALIALLFSSTAFYVVFTSSVQDDSRQKQLGQISQSVAMNVEEMINIAKFSKYSTGNMTKIIDLPNDVGGKSYQIQFITKAGQYYIHSFLTEQKTAFSDSSIPYNTADAPVVFYSGPLTTAVVGAYNMVIQRSATVYGHNGTVVWASTDWDSNGDLSGITVGLGWVASSTQSGG